MLRLLQIICNEKTLALTTSNLNNSFSIHLVAFPILHCKPTLKLHKVMISDMNVDLIKNNVSFRI